MMAAPAAFRAQSIDLGDFTAYSYFFFINSLAIVPEPAAVALSAWGALSVAICALRRRSAV
jgi:hypothetical protein